eukprot:3530823-Prorocentrum_lima.AAC.1
MYRITPWMTEYLKLWSYPQHSSGSAVGPNLGQSAQTSSFGGKIHSSYRSSRPSTPRGQVTWNIDRFERMVVGKRPRRSDRSRSED